MFTGDNGYFLQKHSTERAQNRRRVVLQAGDNVHCFFRTIFRLCEKKNRSRSPIFSEGRGASAQASVRNMIGTIRGRPGLRSWRYCLGARLKFWRQSRDPKKGVGTKSFYFSRLTLNTSFSFVSDCVFCGHDFLCSSETKKQEVSSDLTNLD